MLNTLRRLYNARSGENRISGDRQIEKVIITQRRGRSAESRMRTKTENLPVLTL